jgi:hypothetical protein
VAGLALALCSLHTVGQPRSVSRAVEAANVTRLLRVSAARLYIREATGRNDGPDVEAAQKAAGAKKGDPWCGCERFMWNKLAGLPSPAWPAAARNWSQPSSVRTFYIRSQRGSLDSVKIGDTVTFYYSNLGRVGHVGMDVAHSRPIRRGRPTRSFTVRAGNTGTGGGRDGAGNHDVVYAATDIYAGARWTY